MATPSPRSRSAKTGSGTSSSGPTQPFIGETSTRLDNLQTPCRSMRVGDQLYPVQQPKRIEFFLCKDETEIVRPGHAGKRAAEPCDGVVGKRRRQRQDRDLRPVAR